MVRSRRPNCRPLDLNTHEQTHLMRLLYPEGNTSGAMFTVGLSPSVCLSLSLSVCLSLCLSVCLSVSI